MSAVRQKLPAPYLHCPTIEDRVAAIRALYDIGYHISDGHCNLMDVNLGVKCVNRVPEACYVFVQHKSPYGISFRYWGYGPIIFGRLYELGDRIKTNSLNHFISYLKRWRAAQ